jgi:hypothetical protein
VSPTDRQRACCISRGSLGGGSRVPPRHSLEDGRHLSSRRCLCRRSGRRNAAPRGPHPMQMPAAEGVSIWPWHSAICFAGRQGCLHATGSSDHQSLLRRRSRRTQIRAHAAFDGTEVALRAQTSHPVRWSISSAAVTPTEMLSPRIKQFDDRPLQCEEGRGKG